MDGRRARRVLPAGSAEKERSPSAPTQISSSSIPTRPGPSLQNDLHFRHKISPYLGAMLHGRVAGDLAARRARFSARINSQASHAAESWCADERSRDTSHRRMPHIATMSEEPGRTTRRFLTPPFREVHAASAHADGKPRHDGACRCRRQSARPLEADRSHQQAPAARLAHRYGARRGRLRRRSWSHSRPRLG